MIGKFVQNMVENILLLQTFQDFDVRFREQEQGKKVS